MHRLLGSLGVWLGVVPEAHGFAQCRFQVVITSHCQELFNRSFQGLAVAVHGKAHTEAILGIVLEERIGPYRPDALLGDRVGNSGEGAAID